MSRNVLLAREPREIPTASPAPQIILAFAGTMCGRYFLSLWPVQTVLSSAAPDTDRGSDVWSRRFSESFYPVMVTAVDAVGTYDQIDQWPMIALRMSFCQGIIHAPAQRLHLPLQGCRRQLLPTVYADTRSVATMAPAGAFPAALWSSRERKMVGGVGHVPVLRRTRGKAKRGPGPRRTSAQQVRDRAGVLGRGCGLSPSRRRRLTRCCVAAAGSVL
jgi:hypothetical protein